MVVVSYLELQIPLTQLVSFMAKIPNYSFGFNCFQILLTVLNMVHYQNLLLAINRSLNYQMLAMVRLHRILGFQSHLDWDWNLLDFSFQILQEVMGSSNLNQYFKMMVISQRNSFAVMVISQWNSSAVRAIAAKIQHLKAYCSALITKSWFMQFTSLIDQILAQDCSWLFELALQWWLVLKQNLLKIRPVKPAPTFIDLLIQS